MKKSIFTLSLILLLIALNGCQLASEANTSTSHQLIGVFARINDINAHDPETEEPIDILSENGQAQIYGTINQEDGTVTFPGLKGYALIYYNHEEDGINVWDSPGNGFSNIHTNISDSDITREGTLYYDRNFFSKEDSDYEDEDTTDPSEENDTNNESEMYVSFCNIYQTDSGEIYIDCSEWSMNYGLPGIISTTFSNQQTETFQLFGKSKSNTEKITYTVHIDECDPADAITFTQIDRNGTTIHADSYHAGSSLPETYTWLPDTEYILVTIQSKEGAITYDIINKDDEFYSVFLPIDSIICEETRLEIVH